MRKKREEKFETETEFQMQEDELKKRGITYDMERIEV